MLTMATSLALANYSFNLKNFASHQYLFEKSSLNEGQTAFAAFFSFYLILNSYIPLDLILVIELAKLISTPFMEADAQMKHCYEIPLAGGKTATVL